MFDVFRPFQWARFANNLRNEHTHTVRTCTWEDGRERKRPPPPPNVEQVDIIHLRASCKRNSAPQLAVASTTMISAVYAGAINPHKRRQAQR